MPEARKTQFPIEATPCYQAAFIEPFCVARITFPEKTSNIAGLELQERACPRKGKN